jgi:cyanobactin maturation PatA/PatG family protease
MYLSFVDVPSIVSGLTKLSSGDPRVVVAILDGPVDTAHACLASATLKTISLSAQPNDLSNGTLGHGTHVTSQIFGQSDCGLAGIAPQCTGFLIPVYRGTSGGGLIASSQVDLARAIRTAVDKGAHVINISGGELSPTPEADQFLLDALKYCEEQGVLVVSAAGNDGCECLHVPASIPTVLAVGAMNPETGEPLGFSNWGEAYRANAILAPGKDIAGAAAGGGVGVKSGTSFAAPIVTGTVALMISLQIQRGEPIDVLAVRRAILDAATPCNPTEQGDCRRYLVGTLNVDAAIDAMSGNAVAPSHAIDDETVCLPCQRVGLASDVTTTETPTLAITPSAAQIGPIQPAFRTDNRLAPQPNFTFSGGTILPSNHRFSITNISRSKDIMSDQEGIMTNEITQTPVQNAIVAQEAIAPQAMMQTAGVVASEAPVSAQQMPAAVTPSAVEPSDCGCGCGGGDQLVFALGKLRYDLVTEARKDSLWQAMGENPFDWKNMIKHLKSNPWDAEAVTWTLEIDATPIYAIQPTGPYAAEAYQRLLDVLQGQIDENVERISIPGVVVGTTTLTNGITVPTIVPTMRGMFAWNTEQLLESAATDDAKAKVENFLNRVYYELRSLGQSPQERAINFAATNAFQADRVFNKSAEAGHELDDIAVERSPICRQDSDCWDVILTTFDPMNDRGARMRHRFTVDVSDVVPCTVGAVRSWSVR